MKLTKDEEKNVKILLKIIKGGSMSGGGPSGGSCCKMCGGNFGTDFAHGFLTPWKDAGKLFNFIVPGLGDVLATGATKLDEAIPGARYANTFDALSGNKIKGTGIGGRKLAVPRVGYDTTQYDSLLGGSIGGRVVGGSKRRVGRPCKSR